MKLKRRVTFLILQAAILGGLGFLCSYNAYSSNSFEGEATITIEGFNSVVEEVSLSMGTILPPSTGTATVNVSFAADNTSSFVGRDGGAEIKLSGTRAIFALSGYTCSGNNGSDCTGSGDVKATVDSTVDLVCTTASCGGNIITVILDTDNSRPTVTAGGIKMYVGGQVDIDSNMASGTYSGQYNITFAQ